MELLPVALLLYLLVSSQAGDPIKVSFKEGYKKGRKPALAKSDLSSSMCTFPKKECPGKDVDKQFRPNLNACFTKCRATADCLSLFYDAERICHLRKNSCTEKQMKSVKAGHTLIRLKKGEKCKGDNPFVRNEEVKYGGMFCLVKKASCPEPNLYLKPKKQKKFMDCLKKCVHVRGCVHADYKDGVCYMKSKKCSIKSLKKEKGIDSYIRLTLSEKKCAAGSVAVTTPAPTTPAPTTPAPTTPKPTTTKAPPTTTPKPTKPPKGIPTKGPVTTTTTPAPTTTTTPKPTTTTSKPTTTTTSEPPIPPSPYLPPEPVEIGEGCPGHCDTVEKIESCQSVEVVIPMLSTISVTDDMSIGHAYRARDAKTDVKSCAASAKENFAWFALDFGCVKKIKSVKLFGRSGAAYQLTKFDITVTKSKPPCEFKPAELCAKEESVKAWTSKTYKCSKELTGRYLAVRLRKRSTKRALHLCEIQYNV